MRWVVKGQAQCIPVEGNMHQAISLGVGHLERVDSDRVLGTNLNYPVYISEPLMILALSSVFESQPLSSRITWISNACCAARNKPSLGYVLEEVVLLVIVEHFGGKATPLQDVFHVEPLSWGSRKVSLVSLVERNGVMQCTPASWTKRSSDRLGLKAESPRDVLAFLKDPQGRTFLLPDDHMGPDLLCFLQDTDTKDLIILLLQTKLKKSHNQSSFREATNSLNLNFFYTQLVRLIKPANHCHYDKHRSRSGKRTIKPRLGYRMLP